MHDMARETSLMLQRLVDEWGEVKTALGRLNSTATVRPENGWNVFRAVPGTAGEVVGFDFGPVVFNVPERATDVSANLFVAVAGRLAFRRSEFNTEKVLVTDSFTTKAAYFRKKNDNADHIYGVHYDFALDELGHPVFHCQMRNYPEMWASVNKHYGIDGHVTDCLNGILKTVRVPTAQMDVFSFFLQLCADHLLFRNSGRDERVAFNSLVEKSSFIRGAGYRAARLTSGAAGSCYRACHWYAVVV